MRTETHPAPHSVMTLDVGERATFLVRTYAHLFGAIALFVLIQVGLFSAGAAGPLANLVAGNWMIFFGAFMLTSWLASRFAARASTLPVQYLMLFAFVVVWAVIFTPMIYIANQMSVGDGSGTPMLAAAAITTLGGFAALSLIVFITRKDFSFLRGILMWGGFGALGLVVASMIFGFHMGTWFSVAMVVFAGAAILHDTSNVLHHYPEDRYVSAALELFGSIALLFWYVLRLFLSSRD